MRGTDAELKELENHLTKLKDIDYNLLEIIMMQDDIYDKYHWKGKENKEEEDT